VGEQPEEEDSFNLMEEVEVEADMVVEREALDLVLDLQVLQILVVVEAVLV
jgi:hypothetical protein